MQKSRVYAVYDRATMSFGTLMEIPNDAEAIRSFMPMCWDPRQRYHVHAEDFTLFAMGEVERKTTSAEGEMTGVFAGEFYPTPIKVIGLWEIRDLESPAKPRFLASLKAEQVDQAGE